jgi:spore coat protein U-like protein
MVAVLALWLVGVLVPRDARAGSPTCTMTTSSIAFGNVDVLPGTSVDTAATISITCSGGGGGGQRLCISIGSGTNFSGSQRQMAGPGGATLNYDLYKDASRSILWGSWQTGYDASGLQVDVAQFGTAKVTVYGRVLGGQQIAEPGSYSTTFTANPYLQYGDKGTASCPSGAKNTSNSASVTAMVASTCRLTTTNLNFGTTGAITANVDSTAQVIPQCSNGLPYSLSLDGGLSGATDPAQRKMSKSSEQIIYGLYRDAGRSQPWGSTLGTDTVAGNGTGLNQSLTIYGRVPPQTTGSPGVYSDTIIVTVSY